MAWVNLSLLSAIDPPTKREKEEVLEQWRRKKKTRFYADENLPTKVISQLRKFGADVLTAKEAGRLRHPDENHAAEALRLGRILITCDRDYLDERKFPIIHCPAIAVCIFGGGSVKEIVATLNLLAPAFHAPHFYDKWVKIDVTPTGATECWRFQNGTTNRTRKRIYRGHVQEWT